MFVVDSTFLHLQKVINVTDPIDDDWDIDQSMNVYSQMSMAMEVGVD